MSETNFTSCKSCGKEIAKNAVICPNCGAKPAPEKKPAYKKWWFWLIIFIVFAAIVSPSKETTTSNPNNNVAVQENVKTPIKEKFTLQSHEGSYDNLGMAFYIKGTIKNNTNKKYSYVQVTFNTYDKDGAQLGTALANINNLEPNGIWKYEAIGFAEDIASYKFVEITGF